MKGVLLNKYQNSILESLMYGHMIVADFENKKWNFFIEQRHTSEREKIKFSTWKRLRELGLIKLKYRSNYYKIWTI